MQTCTQIQMLNLLCWLQKRKKGLCYATFCYYTIHYNLILNQLIVTDNFFNSFICKKFIPVKNSIMTIDPDISHKRYGLIKCSNGQYVSTLHKYDSHKDCSDGTDELNCYCFKNGKMIIDNIYCSETFSLRTNCTCSTLFTNHG